jgi:lysozyme
MTRPSFQSRAEDIIKSAEGFSEKAYWDVDGWSIGYGFHEGISKGQRMSREEADRVMSEKTKKYAESVDRSVTNKNITDEQKAALTSFAFNVGVGAFEKSSLLKKVNAGDLEGAKAEFARWNKAGGKTNLTLVKRRAEEAEMFLPSEKGTTTQIAVNTKHQSMKYDNTVESDLRQALEIIRSVKEYDLEAA